MLASKISKKTAINAAVWAVEKIYFYFFKRAVYKAIEKANAERKLMGYKILVVKVGGWPKVYRKKDLKRAIAKKRFKKGVSIESLEKEALYVTT